MADIQTKLTKTIQEQQDALATVGCDPTWLTFEKTYNWFNIKRNMTMRQQDEFQELWFKIYKKRGVKGKLAGKPLRAPNLV